MKKKFNYTQSTFYISLVILCLVLVMAYPYLSSVAQFTKDIIVSPGELSCTNGLDNGDFSQGFYCWEKYVSGIGSSGFSFDIIDEAAVMLSTSKDGVVGGLYQEFNLNVETIEFDVSVIGQTLDCMSHNSLFFRYPAGIYLVYNDSEGNGGVWWRGYYTIGGNCDGHGEYLPAGTIVHKEIVIADVLPPGKNVTKLMFFSGGHLFKTTYDNVVLTGEFFVYPPVAIFNVDSAVIYQGESIIFDGSDSYDQDGQIVSWEWEVKQIFESGTIVKDTTIIRQEVEIINPVEPQPEIIFAAEEPPSINPPEQISGKIYEYLFDDIGNYIVTLTLTDDSGETGSYSIGILVIEEEIEDDEDTPIQNNFELRVNAGVDKTVYVGDMVVFEGFAEEVEIINPVEPQPEIIFAAEEPPSINPPEQSDPVVVFYEWDFDGDGTIDWSSGIESVIDYVYNTAGGYTATFTATDSYGVSASDTITITVLEQPVSIGDVVSIPSGGGGTYNIPDGLVQKITTEDSGTISEIESDDKELEVTDETEDLEETPLITLFFITIVGLALLITYVMYKSGKFKNIKV
ncbi:MAG: PKD domain-containing protein [Nanoarchaeota archaeon]|nr:PKD domain-containing protein [Nanoarchaeota archaeon]